VNTTIARVKLFTVSLCLCTWASADTYTYDTLNRLTAVSYTSGGGQTYSYDSVGNRVSMVVTAPPDVGSSTTTSTTTTTTSTDATTTTTVSSTTTTTQASGALSYPLMLAQGWNLLGNSLSQSMSVESVYGDPAMVTTVWKWDVAVPGWQFYTPQMDAPTLQTYAASKGYDVLNMINPGEGYWVNAKVTATLPAQTGTAFSLTSANLVTGWNLVATGSDVTPSAFNTSLSATPPSPGVIPINLTTLWAWDNPLSQWYFYAPSLEANGGLAAYITGKGYMDFTQRAKTLGNGVGFWVNRP